MGSELAIVEVDIIVIVVEGLMRVGPEVAALGFVGIAVEELTGIGLEVAALGVVGIVVGELTRVVPEVVALEVVETGVVIDVDMVLVLRHSLACSSQKYPGSQHPSGPHWGHPSPHSPEQWLSGKHSYPFLQQDSAFMHLKYPSSHRGGGWHPGFPLSPTQVYPVGQHARTLGQRYLSAGHSVCRFSSPVPLVAGTPV